jgi:hypothetical protein
LLNDEQNKLVRLVGEKEALKEKMKALEEEMEGCLKTLGVGHAFQDPRTFAVYKVEVPKGAFTYYKHIDYKRTNLAGEKGSTNNTLAKGEAKDMGYVIPY